MTTESSSPVLHISASERLNKFDVRFIATTGYKIAVTARSEAEAIRKAKRIWRSSGDRRFIAWLGEDDGWEAFGW
ncbi:MAG TPA: hypothetical protein VH640_01260 [Bryobacteraceae bacterium]|jgi:hypothetical protein